MLEQHYTKYVVPYPTGNAGKYVVNVVGGVTGVYTGRANGKGKRLSLMTQCSRLVPGLAGNEGGGGGGGVPKRY